jgi:hypothetical protein
VANNLKDNRWEREKQLRKDKAWEKNGAKESDGQSLVLCMGMENSCKIVLT